MSRYGILPAVSLLVCVLISLPNVSLSAEERRTALVIGNGSYKLSSLRNPVNDARDMAEVLRDLGFTVIFRENADQREMEKSVYTFGRQLRDGGIGLFYYAGHGIQVDGRNYLIPVDAEIETESDVKFEAVDAGRILGKMEDAGNDLNIVILDACRDNPFARGFRSSAQGLARMDAPRGSIISYSTAPGSVAADGEGRNGTFTKHLLKHMRTPGVAIEEVLKKVRTDVAKETDEKQIPWESSSLMGAFYFASGRGIAVSPRSEEPRQQEMDPGLKEERERLERERLELERLKTELEAKKLEVERSRLEAEKKRLQTASLPPQKPIPNRTRFQGDLLTLIEKAEHDFPTAEGELTWRGSEGYRQYTTNLSLSDAKQTNLWREPDNSPYLLCQIFNMAPGVQVFPVYERMVKETKEILDSDWHTSSSKVKGKTEFVAVNRRTGVKIKIGMLHYKKKFFSQGPDENDLDIYIFSPSSGESD